MSDPARHLRVVDTATGELVEDEFAREFCPGCEHERKLRADVEQQLADAEEELRRKRATIRLLNAQLTAELEKFERRPEVERVHKKWQQLCGHPRSPLDAKRATDISRMLTLTGEDGEKAYSERDAYLAVIGAAYDPFVDEKGKRHDSIGLIFRSADKFEDFAVRGARVLRSRPDLRLEAEPPEEPQGTLIA